MEPKKLSFEQMENLEGGGALSCIGGSAFTVGIFVAAAATATVVTAGAATVAIIGLWGGIGLSCLTDKAVGSGDPTHLKKIPSDGSDLDLRRYYKSII